MKNELEVWKWCGFSPVKRSVYRWKYTPSDTYSDGEPFTSLPELTLDNLFKYAWVKFVGEFGITKARDILVKWVEGAYMALPRVEDLFTAIMEVVDEK
jgi:hypothetical protein